jgi:hypothetical protein
MVKKCPCLFVFDRLFIYQILFTHVWQNVYLPNSCLQVAGNLCKTYLNEKAIFLFEETSIQKERSKAGLWANQPHGLRLLDEEDL